jgi:hypothetical protein
MALRTEDAELSRGGRSRESNRDGIVDGAAWHARLAGRSAGVIGDKLHLGSRRSPTSATLLARPSDASACLASPLLGERFDENAAVHVQLDDLDARSSSEIPLEAVVVPRRRPRGDCAEQGTADRFLVKRHGHRVDPVGHPPDPTFQVCGLAGEESEENL